MRAVPQEQAYLASVASNHYFHWALRSPLSGGRLGPSPLCDLLLYCGREVAGRQLQHVGLGAEGQAAACPHLDTVGQVAAWSVYLRLRLERTCRG